jgi:hypothetical protein
MTPAEAAGIGRGLGNDKWLGLIRKAKECNHRNVLKT